MPALRHHPFSAVCLLVLELLSSCAGPPRPSVPHSGTWVGYGAIADDRLLPIRASLSLDPDSLAGFFSVANERIDIPEISRWGDSLRFDFSEYGAIMVGRLEPDRFSGQYIRTWDDTTSFPFVLFHNPGEIARPPADSSVAGTFRVVFGNGDEVDDSAIAVLSVDGGALTGAVIHPSGDYGLLEGIQENGTIRLYRFTGWQALYFELTESEIGYRGRFQLRAEPAKDVAFIRTETGARETGRITRMKNRNASFLFSGLTSDGEIITSQDSMFVDKPVVIDIMGTWCHNCLDAAPLLEEAYERYAGDSLQVVSLAFEVHEDAVAGLENLEMFRRRFGITYPILYCGSLEPENVSARLHSQLEDFFSYPTTLFVNRDGKVVDIQTGFNGPGAGDRWDEQIAELRDAIQRIVEG